MTRKQILLTAAALLVGAVSFAQVHRMDIDLKKVGAPIQPTMYGIFFESSSRTSTTRPTAACTPSS